MSYRLGLNTGFAVNRYPEPEEWVKIVGEFLNVRLVQFTADLLNPCLPDEIINEYLSRIKAACEKYDVEIGSTFTGAYTRVNHLAHPNEQVRQYWVSWFKKYIDMSVSLGASSMGSHFGIFSASDNSSPSLREQRRSQNIQHWHKIGEYALESGLEYLTWEPMSISREQGETISECDRLNKDVNRNSPIPFKLCLDVDHGDLSSENPNDTDPYSWLETFAKESPCIHLKQTLKDKGGHWPFTPEYNQKGKITPQKVLSVLDHAGVKSADLYLELSFREREPFDSQVQSTLRTSVDYWREYISE